jgi:hypothetical protein
MIDQYDTWEKTTAAGVCVDKAFEYLHTTRPDKKAPEADKAAWELIHREAVKWSVSIHERRIELNLKELKKSRKS